MSSPTKLATVWAELDTTPLETRLIVFPEIEVEIPPPSPSIAKSWVLRSKSTSPDEPEIDNVWLSPPIVVAKEEDKLEISEPKSDSIAKRWVCAEDDNDVISLESADSIANLWTCDEPERLSILLFTVAMFASKWASTEPERLAIDRLTAVILASRCASTEAERLVKAAAAEADIAEVPWPKRLSIEALNEVYPVVPVMSIWADPETTSSPSASKIFTSLPSPPAIHWLLAPSHSNDPEAGPSLSLTLRPAKAEAVPLSSIMLSPNSIAVELTVVVVPLTIKLPASVKLSAERSPVNEPSPPTVMSLVTCTLEPVISPEATKLSVDVSPVTSKSLLTVRLLNVWLLEAGNVKLRFNVPSAKSVSVVWAEPEISPDTFNVIVGSGTFCR